jgi:hypothetical protein
VFYNATRKLVLRGVDGIVFVADSQRAKMDENIESLSNMYENLKENGIDRNEIPIVMQYNKRDLPEVGTVEELEEMLNPDGLPYVEASAVSGAGVFDTLKRITKLVLEQTKKRTAVGAQAETPTAAPAAGGPASASPRKAAVPRGVATPQTESWSPEHANVATATAEPPVRPETEPTPQRSDLDIVSGAPVMAAPTRIVHAPQRSLRIRSKKRSFWSRLLGWLFGR